MLHADERSLTLHAEVAVEPGFDFLSEEYRRLFAAAVGVPFQAPLWLWMMHGTLAPQLGATQHTITFRDPRTGQLFAVLPMVVRRAGGVRLFEPADFGLCDSNGIVASPRVLSALAASPDLVRRLDTLGRGTDVMLFRKVRRDGVGVAGFFPGATASTAENAAFDLTVDDDFDRWRLRVLRRALTKELGRLGRQLEREHGDYRTEHANTPEQVLEAFDFLRSVRHGRFDDDLLLNPTYFAFYRDYAVAALASDEARVYVSTLAGRPVAALFGMHSDGDFHALQLGHDADAFGKYSLGLQIIYRTIRLRHGQGRRRFSLGLGNTGYKTHFRVEETLLDNYVQARTLRGAAVGFVYTRAKQVKNLLRRLAEIR